MYAHAQTAKRNMHVYTVARTDLDVQNKVGRTALMYAAKYGHIAALQWLLEVSYSTRSMHMQMHMHMHTHTHMHTACAQTRTHGHMHARTHPRSHEYKHTRTCAGWR